MTDTQGYQRFFAELKRRRVFRVMAVYGAVAFAISWRASLAAIGAGVVVIGLSHFLVLRVAGD